MATTATSDPAVKAEDVLGQKFDKCLVDTSIKVSKKTFCQKAAQASADIGHFAGRHGSGGRVSLLPPALQEENVAGDLWTGDRIWHGLRKLPK